MLKHQKKNDEVVDNTDDPLKRKEKRALRQQSRWKVLECNVCGQRFSQYQILATYMLKHQKKNDEVVDNTGAPLKRKEKRALRQQSRWKVLECNFCGQRFSQYQILATYMLDHVLHTLVLRILVKSVEKDFHTSQIFQNTMHRSESISMRNLWKKVFLEVKFFKTLNIIIQYKCDFCDKHFSTNANLKKHKLLFHEGKGALGKKLT